MSFKIKSNRLTLPGEISDKKAVIPYNVGQQIKLSVLVRYFILSASNGRNSHPQLLEWVNHE
jgi:hypothetical protein|tara:strand:- start:35753 stop:35938 length:186 start_codon:yes stop_codon:yes gene_type:complete